MTQTTEFAARVAEFEQAITRTYDAMTLAASENRGGAYADLKSKVRALREELHTAQTTGRFGDGVSRRSETRSVKSSEIQVGDIVRAHGMRCRVDDVRQVENGGSTRDDYPIVTIATTTVLNMDEVREAGVVPMSFLCRDDYYVPGEGWKYRRTDCWVVQGNDLATWLVEDGSDPLADDPAANYQDGPCGDR